MQDLMKKEADGFSETRNIRGRPTRTTWIQPPIAIAMYFVSLYSSLMPLALYACTQARTRAHRSMKPMAARKKRCDRPCPTHLPYELKSSVYTRSQVKGSTIVQESNSPKFRMKRETKGTRTSFSVTLTLLNLFDWKILLILQILENKAAKVVTKPTENSQGDAMHAISHPRILATPSSMLSGTIVNAIRSEPKAIITRKRG
mmetsp:Transcript_24207/g.39517  ORF Transcript_24207/g.39517 Transcript_24207/m.39517 type:complete len:202 (-) Transcript_24207:2573-3178(-)